MIGILDEREIKEKSSNTCICKMSNRAILERLPELVKGIRATYGSTFENDPKILRAIVNKLDLKSQYRSKNLQILDIYAGPSLQSLIVNEELCPKTQVLMDDRKKFVELYQDVYRNHPSIVPYNQNPYKWESFLELTDKDQLITPEFQKRDHIHDKFLITANLTNKKGEQLFVQYLQCVANQNWLQRFGLVKMLVWIPQTTARKLFSPFSTKDRNRITLLSEAVTDTRLIATSDLSEKFFPKECLEKFKPIKLEGEAGLTENLSLVEINPKDHNLDLDSWDYVVQKLMILKSKPVRESLEILGHGAHDWFLPRLSPRILDMKPQAMTYLDINEIGKEFALWPFKPPLLIEFYEDGTE